MKVTTIHVSGVCLGIIQTTWEQVPTWDLVDAWTAVFILQLLLLSYYSYM